MSIPTGKVEHAAEGAGGVAADGVAVVRREWLGQLVPDGETVLLALKPHPLFVVLSVLTPLAALVATAGVAWWIGGRSAATGDLMELVLRRAVVVALGCATLLVAWQCLEWLTRLYVLTDRRVMRVSGVLRQTTFDLPLRRVQHVVLYRSLRERLVDLGTIGFSSAGPGRAAEFWWYMVAHPVEQMETVRRAIERYAGGGEGGTGGCGGGGEGGVA